MSAAYFEDLKDRNNDAISNEMIRNGETVLDTYRVTSDAIPGGMGCVWRVHHSGWDADLAMKRPHPRFFSESSDRTKKQFVEECDNWINLGLHPNIVSCYYVREIGGVPTIFSEWMENGSLRDRMKDGTLYEGSEEEIQERILNIAIQAVSGLQYSHENNLVHQDMKPDNLLLTGEWGAKVADFGIAKAKSGLGEGQEAVKVSGYTLPYCPAEQKNGEEPARWMDIYAWALTVLEMYAGKLLWSSGAEAKDHFDEYPAQCAHAVPDQLKTLLKSCLTDRPDSFDAIKKDLITLYSEVTGREYPDPGFTGNADSA
ncbi:MAG: serine/threonine protein kinase, partial [Lachnospiraceae bacterium]|nr:serine/threonine protein kinase [Lachnospiraceae bacterium]